MNQAGEATATPGAKMLFLIKRRPEASHEELIAHWFANHMPNVVRAQEAQAKKGRLHAWRYIATLYGADRHGDHPWDGMAQLWFDEALPKPDTPHGTEPVDSFQQKAQPYMPWATTEYVIMDGSDQLASEPLTLNAPYPFTRSGFYKVTFLLGTKPGADHGALFDHWLSTHAPNVAATMNKVGGFRYVVSQSISPGEEQFAGMAELYFPDEAGWAEFRSTIAADGMQQWTDPASTLTLRSSTEMVGIA